MVLCLFSACSPWWKAEQDPSCANIVKIVRFDKAVDDFVRTGNVAFSQRLSTDYPMETRILVENMLHLGSVADELIYGELRAYYCHAGLEQLSADVRKRFANLSVYERQLGAALNRLKSELPGLRSPYVYTQISGFRQSIVVSDTLVGISLDKYMGADYPAYARFFTPVQRGTMTPGRMVPDLLSFYLMAQFPPREEHKELIYAMIQIGKIQWAVAQALDTNTASASGFRKLPCSGYSVMSRHAGARSNSVICSFPHNMMFLHRSCRLLLNIPILEMMPHVGPVRGWERRWFGIICASIRNVRFMTCWCAYRAGLSGRDRITLRNGIVRHIFSTFR